MPENERSPQAFGDANALPPIEGELTAEELKQVVGGSIFQANGISSRSGRIVRGFTNAT